MFKNILLALTFTTLLLGAGCKKENWIAFMYPDGTLGRYIMSTPFNTYAECKAWVDAKLDEYDRDVEYECGKNCVYQGADVDLYKCDETLE